MPSPRNNFDTYPFKDDDRNGNTPSTQKPQLNIITLDSSE